MQQLLKNTFLQGGKYKIEKVLGQGGFGITYLATQELLDRKVCIKEFFFKEYCERDEATSHVSLGTQNNHELVERFMNKFLKEARTISQLEHPHIIRIHDIFKENNTAYYVMEYIEGESLADRVNHYGCLPESEAVEYIKQIASALDFIHQQSINHLDVKPANIMVRKSDSKAILIDFGLSKQYDAQGGQTSTTPVGISHGYAPMEQYNMGGVSTFSPQTDIYSLGATLFKLVTGQTPPQASDILNDGLSELPFALSSKVKNAINRAMQVRKKDRPKDVKSFLDLIETSNSTVSNGETKNVKPQAKQVEDDTTMVLNKSEMKEKVYSSRYVDDASKPIISFEAEEKKTRSYIPILICTIIIFIGIITFKISGLDKSEAVMIKNADAITNEFEEKRINDSIASVRREEAEKRKNDSINELASLAAQSVQKVGAEGMKKEIEQMHIKDEKVSIGTEYKSLDMSENVYAYLQEARNGNAYAQYKLGFSFYTGDGVRKNYSEAVKWLRKSAEQGYAKAQNHLGFCYYNGQGVTQNYSEAVKWYRKSAEQGNALGQYNLGTCYESAKGVTQNYSEAVKWYRKSAEQGNTNAQNNLALCYKSAKGVTQNYSEAIKWYRKSAEQGNDVAQYNLGVIYYRNGQGTSSDCIEAVRWWEKAVAQNHIDATYKLGYCYYEGHGVTQDLKKAEELWKKAADSNHTEAKKMLQFLQESKLLNP